MVNKFSLILFSLEAGCGAWTGGTELAASGLFRGLAVGATADTGLIGDKAGRAAVEEGAENFELVAEACDPRGVGVDAEELVDVRSVGVEALLGVEDRELGLVGSFALN